MNINSKSWHKQQNSLQKDIEAQLCIVNSSSCDSFQCITKLASEIKLMHSAAGNFAFFVKNLSTRVSKILEKTIHELFLKLQRMNLIFNVFELNKG